MNKIMALVVGAAAIGMSLQIGAARAQGAPQTVGLVKFDQSTVSTGYRASKVVGSTVVNEANEKIGKVDDVIISKDGKQPYAILSVGGFLGMGDHLVVVPYESLRVSGENLTLPGATKDELMALPNVTYVE